jgi:ferrous iron transport protein A
MKHPIQGRISLGYIQYLGYKRSVKTLLQISSGTSVRVIDFAGGINLRSKLTQYGIYPGDHLRLLRRAPLGGPLLVECNEREIALGRGVADKIFVEIDSCE